MIGYIAGALTTIAFAPQLLKALTAKSTKDVSFMMLLCSTSGMILWLFHGILIKGPALVGANSISVILAPSLLSLKLKNGCGSSIFGLSKKSRKSKDRFLISRK
jgi:MtN3 and saliva related transmembrane protein